MKKKLRDKTVRHRRRFEPLTKIGPNDNGQLSNEVVIPKPGDIVKLGKPSGHSFAHIATEMTKLGMTPVGLPTFEVPKGGHAKVLSMIALTGGRKIGVLAPLEEKGKLKEPLARYKFHAYLDGAVNSGELLVLDTHLQRLITLGVF